MSKQIKFRVLIQEDLTPFQDMTVGKVYDGVLYAVGEETPYGFTVDEGPMIEAVDDADDDIDFDADFRAAYFEYVE